MATEEDSVAVGPASRRRKDPSVGARARLLRRPSTSEPGAPVAVRRRATWPFSSTQGGATGFGPTTIRGRAS